MEVCCPVCASEFPIEAGMFEADAKRLAAILAKMEPALGVAALGYLRLFKPAKTALRIARAAKLARELADLVATGTVCRDERAGVRRAATPAMWTAGIEQMLAQRASLTLPLDGHNYLRAVVFGLADKADAAIERQKEADARVGKHPARESSKAALSSRETPYEAEIAVLRSQLDFGLIDQAKFDAFAADARARLGGKQ